MVLPLATCLEESRAAQKPEWSCHHCPSPTAWASQRWETPPNTKLLEPQHEVPSTKPLTDSSDAFQSAQLERMVPHRCQEERPHPNPFLLWTYINILRQPSGWSLSPR